jgi:predicted O-methyltransferase YrrM
MRQKLDPSLRFLVQALRPRKIAALGAPDLLEALRQTKSLGLSKESVYVVDPSAEIAETDPDTEGLAEDPARAQARLLSVSRTADIPEKIDLVLVGEGQRAALEPAYCLHWAQEAEAFEIATGRQTRARLQTGRESKDREGLLAMGMAPPPAARERLDAIRAASQRESPTAPIGDDVGALLFLLTRAGRVRRALEVGAGAGAATLWLASAFAGRGGSLVSVERDSRMLTLARKNLKAAGLEDKVDLRIGELERIAYKLGKGYDLVFFDDAYEDRLDNLEAILPLLGAGALIVSHGGQDAATALARYHTMLQLHPRVKSTLRLGLGKGLSIALLN